MMRILNLLSIIVLLTVLFSCGEASIPRPYGYFRVDLPAHSYRTIDTLNLPYRFDLPSSAQLISRQAKGEQYWIDIYYPRLNASIYCSYKHINKDLQNLSEDSRKIAYKHSIKADGIGETPLIRPGKRVYGILYDIKGNTASSLQFVLTDSTHHFIRGALYFNNVPNKDSIAPMAEFVRQDVIRLMESLEWKK